MISELSRSSDTKVSNLILPREKTACLSQLFWVTGCISGLNNIYTHLSTDGYDHSFSVLSKQCGKKWTKDPCPKLWCCNGPAVIRSKFRHLAGCPHLQLLQSPHLPIFPNSALHPPWWGGNQPHLLFQFPTPTFCVLRPAILGKGELPLLLLFRYFLLLHFQTQLLPWTLAPCAKTALTLRSFPKIAQL